MKSHATLFLVLLSLTCIARADVKPAALFSDHMVLQQGAKVPVWGWADPGEQVSVALLDQKQTATTGADGKWTVNFAALLPGGPFEMTIAGKNTVKISDVLVGEVWLGSGQSNMEFVVSKNLEKYPGKAQRFAGVVNEEEEIAEANYPQIRMFTVKQKFAADPQADVEGTWEVCTPETVPGFSAVGYFFSRDLHRSINRPVGFIRSAVGASCAQAWVSKDAMAADPKLVPLLNRFSQSIDQYNAAIAARASAPPAPATAPATQQARGGRGRGAGGPRNPVTDQHNPYVLYNGMIRPLQPYAIKGVLWYQGESITEGIELYPNVVNTLISSWRKEWGYDFSFYFVQLAALNNSNSNRPEVREAQARSLALPNTAMAVTIDIGNATDVHPHNKQTLGNRLARIARARDYGQKVEYSGPVYDSMSVEEKTIRVKFTHADAGLIAIDGDALKGFEIAGADGKYVEATAKIDGKTVIVSAESVAEPKSVRYAWNRWPVGANLFNQNGLPAPQFRSDQ
jgi:sialate O-acetylesterase